MYPLLILAYYDAVSIDAALNLILTMDPLLILACVVWVAIEMLRHA